MKDGLKSAQRFGSDACMLNKLPSRSRKKRKRIASKRRRQSEKGGEE